MSVFADIHTMAITGAQLAAFRKDLGMTQEELAKDLNIPRSTLVDWERHTDKEIPIRAHTRFRNYCFHNFKSNMNTQKFEDGVGKPVGMSATIALALMLGDPVGAGVTAVVAAKKAAILNNGFKLKCPHCEKSITIPNLNDCTYDCPYCLQLFKYRDGGLVITAGKAE